MAPLIGDALLALDRPRDVIKLVESIFANAEQERRNVRLTEVLDKAHAALPKAGPARVSADDRAAAHVFADEILLRLADEAWAYEERGDHPRAIELYLRAAEVLPLQRLKNSSETAASRPG